MVSDQLRLASFDGGGQRAFSQLIMMKRFMHQIRWKVYPNEPNRPMRPCDYFDLMAGSDTGGIIVILLVKLKLTVDEAISEFGTIIEEVYAKGIKPRERTERLKACMERLLTKRNFPLDLALENSRKSGHCLGFIMATASLHVSDKVRLRTYYAQSDPPSGINVIDAALATCASPQEFLPVTVGTGYEKCVYTGAGVGVNNPVRQILDETEHIFRGEPISILLSLGSGDPGVLALNSEKDDLGLYELMREMMIDCEREALEVRRQMGHFDYYFRFSVVQGMQKVDDRAEDLSWIAAQTNRYFKLKETVTDISNCIQKMTCDMKTDIPEETDPIHPHIQGAALVPVKEHSELASERGNNPEQSYFRNPSRRLAIMDALSVAKLVSLSPGLLFGDQSPHGAQPAPPASTKTWKETLYARWF
ncbi:hypothetical protein M408DRAFT_23860 [Serendipita vermifera MAFF 305830]|uniref:PNPLA domain-containing protein n=1 Tax=Serendipita vermifera MAFF 305830 TaxID=933852 RepID=A0A0C3B9P5_SERVB|nr:hypothetical protein M408DRAFT_23860 [Serendipita vermifera MAFF 305830]